MKNVKILFVFVFAAIAVASNAQNNAGLKLPAGFKATLFADTIGSARHIAISKNGVLFAKLSRPDKQGRTIIRLEDENKDGVSDKKTGWANYGGTGIFLRGNTLYASSNEAVFKYQLDSKDQVVNPLSPVTIVSGLIDRRQHESKSITLDGQGNVYVNIGAYSNA
jgi:glucose/arabinose dehydrogenase